MWAHLGYLLLIPIVGVGALAHVTKNAGLANLGGWIIAAVYLAVTLKFYRLPRRPLAALLTVAIVPAQVLAHVMLFDGGFAEYWVEEAFVELASLALALAAVMLAYRPSGWGGALLGVVLAGIAFGGFGWPLCQVYLDHAAGPEIWALLALVLASGTWAHVRLVAPAARFEVSEPRPGMDPGFVERAIDFIAPSDDDAAVPNVSDNGVAALIIIQSLLWLVVPSLSALLR